MEMIRAEQLADETMAYVLEKKEAGKDRPCVDEVSGLSSQVKTYWRMWDTLAVKEGVLAKRWESVDGKEVKWLIVLPRGLREKVLDLLHGLLAGSHLGRNKLGL